MSPHQVNNLPSYTLQGLNVLLSAFELSYTVWKRLASGIFRVFGFDLNFWQATVALENQKKAEEMQEDVNCQDISRSRVQIVL
jgi:hypothetical protein